MINGFKNFLFSCDIQRIREFSGKNISTSEKGKIKRKSYVCLTFIFYQKYFLR